MSDDQDPPGTWVEPAFGLRMAIDSPLLTPKQAYVDQVRGPTVSFRTAERQDRDIDVLLQQVPGLPWKTRTDFYRAGGYFLWQYTIAVSKAGHPKLRQRALEEQLATDAHDNAEWMGRLQQTLIDIHNYITSLVNQLALEEVYRVLDEYYEAVLTIPIDYVRNQYIQSIGNLAAVRLAVRLLVVSGLGVPTHYVGVRHAASATTVRNYLPARQGVPAGSAGPESGLRDPLSPGEYSEDDSTGGRATGDEGEQVIEA